MLYAASDQLPQAPCFDPHEVVPTLASFGGCDSTESRDYIETYDEDFRWAGEKYDDCWMRALYDNPGNGPTPHMKSVVLPELRNWDGVDHGTVLSTHLPTGCGLDYAGITYIGDQLYCAAGDDACEQFKNTVDFVCGHEDIVLHQTHGNTHLRSWDQGAIEFLEYWFDKYPVGCRGVLHGRPSVHSPGC